MNTRQDRRIPIALARRMRETSLAVLCGMAHLGPHAYRATDLRGLQGDDRRSAASTWCERPSAVKAHGVEPKWVDGRRALRAESLDASQQLARPSTQVARRLVERGVPLARVRDLLGHASSGAGVPLAEEVRGRLVGKRLDHGVTLRITRVACNQERVAIEGQDDGRLIVAGGLPVYHASRRLTDPGFGPARGRSPSFSSS